MLAITIQFGAYFTSYLSLWLCGRKHLAGPVIGIASTFLWIAMAIGFKAWSLVLFELVYLYLDIRQARLWFQEAHSASVQEQGG